MGLTGSPGEQGGGVSGDAGPAQTGLAQAHVSPPPCEAALRQEAPPICGPDASPDPDTLLALAITPRLLLAAHVLPFPLKPTLFFVF